ncbi:MAG: sulfite exporter TauE/SafE family protein [Candidatus Omnitrophota bacterium]
MMIVSILIGVLAGVASGFFGIGGAVVVVPCLIYLFKFSQHYAQGTALGALILPIGIFAAIRYYQSGNLNLKVAFFISLGFFLGGYIGAVFAHMMPSLILKRCFGVLLFMISIYMMLGK